MRTFGYILFIAGCFGFYHFNEQAKRYDPLPAGYSVEDSLRTDRGKAEVGRFGSAAAAAIGIVLALFPEGR